MYEVPAHFNKRCDEECIGRPVQYLVSLKVCIYVRICACAYPKVLWLYTHIKELLKVDPQVFGFPDYVTDAIDGLLTDLEHNINVCQRRKGNSVHIDNSFQ